LIKEKIKNRKSNDNAQIEAADIEIFDWSNFYSDRNQNILESLLDIEQCSIVEIYRIFFPFRLSLYEWKDLYPDLNFEEVKSFSSEEDFLEYFETMFSSFDKKSPSWYTDINTCVPISSVRKSVDRDTIVLVEGILSLLINSTNRCLPHTLKRLPRLSNCFNNDAPTIKDIGLYLNKIYKAGNVFSNFEKEVVTIAENYIENIPDLLTYDEFVEELKNSNIKGPKSCIERLVKQEKIGAYIRVDPKFIEVDYSGLSCSWRAMRYRNSGNMYYKKRYANLERLYPCDESYKVGNKRNDFSFQGILNNGKIWINTSSKVQVTDLEQKVGFDYRWLKKNERDRYGNSKSYRSPVAGESSIGLNDLFFILDEVLNEMNCLVVDKAKIYAQDKLLVNVNAKQLEGNPKEIEVFLLDSLDNVESINKFIVTGEVVEIFFGKAGVIKFAKINGFIYIHHLLKVKTCYALDLIKLTNPPDNSLISQTAAFNDQGMSLTNCGVNALTDEEIKEYKKLDQEIDQKLEAAKETGNQQEISNYQYAKELNLSQLREQTYKGKSKKIDNSGKKASDAIRKSIIKAYKKIKEKNKKLATYLESHIGTGQILTYSGDIEWVLYD